MTNKQILLHLLNYLRPYKTLVITALSAILFVSLSILSLGIAIKELINEGIKSGNSLSLNISIIYIFCLILTLGIASFVRSFSINTIGEKVINDIRIKLYSHLLGLKFQEFEKIKITDITTHLSGDLELISRIIIDILSFCIRNSIMFLGGIILMFFQSIKLSLITIFIVPVMLSLFLKLGKKIRFLARKIQGFQSDLYHYISETFCGISVIYSFNAQNKKNEEFKNKSEKLIELSVNRLLLRSGFFALAIITIMSAILFVIWIGSIDVINNNLSPGNLISFIFYAASSSMSIGGIAEVVSEFWRCLAGAERVFLLLENQELEAQNNIYHKLINSKTKEIIKFSNVYFSYPSRKDIPVLSGLNFTINEGDFVAIVGPSGSGKSTIFQLLLKFFSATSGNILIYGNNIQKINEHNIRSEVGYVAQDSFVFSESIRKNLEISSSNYSAILKECGLDKIAKKLPKGIDNFLGYSGSGLSGGEKQRIAIARALAYNPNILLLDEATSALDYESEKTILDNIRKIMHGKTIISIAHRISSIEGADKIFVVNNSSIVSEGKHEELIKSCHLYQKLSNMTSP